MPRATASKGRFLRLTTLDGLPVLVNADHVSATAGAGYGTELTLAAGERSVQVSESFDHVVELLVRAGEVQNG